LRKLVAIIALFTLFALAGIWFLTRDPGDASPGAPAAQAPPGPDVPAPAPVTSLRLPVGTAAAPPTSPTPPRSIVYGPPAIEPPKGSWEAVDVAARASALGPAGGPIGRGLNELQPRVAACFDEVTEARYGATARSPASRGEALDPQAAPVLLLNIEISGGQASIVDAPVETQGNASDGLVACAQQVLRGQRFPTPQAKAGRYRLLHPISR
jgi:hypothetical protein